jgi:hypothetical protein
MPRLVTAVFYDRSDAEGAIQNLKGLGLAPDDLYLETEVEPTAEIGRKGGEIRRLEAERRYAGLETGLIIGLTVGLLAGAGLGFMGGAVADLLRATGDATSRLPAALTNPLWSGLIGAALGLVAGGLIGWVVDYTLTRMGAGPPAPRQETLVTARVPEDRVDEAYGALFRSRARHLHVAERSAA